MSIKNNKGITLIALVITIIVLLILAGVTINMVLGDDGIIANAQLATSKHNEKTEMELIELAFATVRTDELLGKEEPVTMQKALEGVFGIGEFEYNKATGTVKVKGGNTYTVDENGKVTLGEGGASTPTPGVEENPYVASYTDDGVPIPTGFEYVEGTKDEGVVISDDDGNEFVWVPVDEVLASGTANYEDDKVSLINNNKDKSDRPQLNGVPTGVEADYEAMKTSVSIYGGFYIGRYETSWTGSRVASVANVTAMSGYTTIDGARANWYTLYNKQKELYNKESDSVVSGMIYGSQWDAVMDWMSGVENPNAVDPDKNLYIEDSTEMGHYCYDADRNLITDEKAPIKTGSNSAYSVKNIFDLAGNYYEWSQEAYDYDDRVDRGGYFLFSGSDRPMASHGYGDPTSANVCVSSRLQLYIK